MLELVTNYEEKLLAKIRVAVKRELKKRQFQNEKKHYSPLTYSENHMELLARIAYTVFDFCQRTDIKLSRRDICRAIARLEQLYATDMLDTIEEFKIKHENKLDSYDPAKMNEYNIIDFAINLI